MALLLIYRIARSMRCTIATMLFLSIFVSEPGLSTSQIAQRATDGTRVRYHSSPNVRVVPDIVFARYGKRALRLDLYLPIGSKEPVPGVILIRGEQSSKFAELYRQAGGQSDLVLIPNAPHPFWNYTPWFQETMNRAAAFIQRVANEGF